MAPRMENETLEDVKIMWRNFEGREGKFNAKGDRNFVIFLDPEKAAELHAKGWTVKELAAREEGDEPQATLKVKVKYSERARPPRVVMVTSRGRTNLTEDMLVVLDWADFAKVDVMIRPFTWEVGGKTGVSAYLQSIYVTIREDELELKYADVPELESGQAALTSGATPGDEFEDLGEINSVENQYAIEQRF